MRCQIYYDIPFDEYMIDEILSSKFQSSDLFIYNIYNGNNLSNAQHALNIWLKQGSSTLNTFLNVNGMFYCCIKLRLSEIILRLNNAYVYSLCMAWQWLTSIIIYAIPRCSSNNHPNVASCNAGFVLTCLLLIYVSIFATELLRLALLYFPYSFIIYMINYKWN